MPHTTSLASGRSGSDPSSVGLMMMIVGSAQSVQSGNTGSNGCN